MTAELRLNAEVSVDGQKAAAELKRLTGETANARGALDEAKRAATAAAAEYRKLNTSTAEGAASARVLRDALVQARAAEIEAGKAAATAAQQLDRYSQSQLKAGNSAGQLRASTANLGQQIGDISVGFAAGTSAATIFAQQGGQVAFAISGMGGVLGTVGTFLSGPFGAILLGATAIVGSLAAAHSRTADAALNQGSKEKSLSDTLRELDEATGIANKSVAENNRLKGIAAEKSIALQRQERAELDITLQLARARLSSALADAQVGGAKGANSGANYLTQAEKDTIATLTNQIAELDKVISAADAKARKSVIFGAATQAAEAATDPRKKIEQAYEAERTRIQGLKEGANFEGLLEAAMRKRDTALGGIKESTKAATAVQREHNKELRAAAKEADQFATALGKIAAENQRYIDQQAGRTASETFSASGFKFRRGENGDFNGQIQEKDRQDSGLADLVEGAESRLPEVGKKIADGFREGSLADAAALGQIIGGKAGQVFAGVAALGFGKAGPDGITRDLTGAGGKVEKLLAPLGDVFGGGGKKFAGLIGQAAGGAATGSLVSGIGDALGIKNSKTGAAIGGAIGSFIPIPGGEIIGSILGGLLPGLFGSKPKGSTTISSSGGAISQSSTGDKAIAKATGTIGNSITDALQAIAQQLGADIGTFSVSIGKEGDRYRVDTAGLGRTKKNNRDVIGYDTDEGAAITAALADAIKDGAIVTSPRVQTALTRYADNVNKAVAEALKVKGLEDLLADRENPFTTTFRNLELQLKQRAQVAKDYGFDLVQIEKINGEDRAKALKDTLAQATGSIRNLLNDLQFGTRATGSPTERLAGLVAERDRVGALAKAGDVSQNDVFASLVQQIDDLQKQTFGISGGFATGRAESVSLLNELVKQTEERINAAAAAATTNDKLTEANASLDDLVAGQSQTNARLAEIAAQFTLAGFSGGGGIYAGNYVRLN